MGAYGRVTAHFYNAGLERVYDDEGALSTVSGEGAVYPQRANSKRKFKRIGNGAIYIPPNEVARHPLIQVGHICVAYQHHIINDENRYVAHFVIKTIQLRIVEEVPLQEVSGPEITKELADWLVWQDIGEQQGEATAVAVANSAGDSFVDVDEGDNKYEDSWRIRIGISENVKHFGTVTDVDMEGGSGGSDRVSFTPALWNDVAENDFVSFTDYSNPATDDITQILAKIGEPGGDEEWDLTVTGGGVGGTVAGTSHVAVGQTVFDMLNDAAAFTGEWWQLKSRATADAAPIRHLEWLSNNSSSGVELVSPGQALNQTRAADPAYGIIESFTRELEDVRVSHVIPTGGGTGNETVTLASITDPVPAGYTLETNDWWGYSTLSKDSLADPITGTLAPAFRYVRVNMPSVASRGSTDANLAQAANQLLKAAVGWLDERDDTNYYYHCRCVVNKNLEVGQTIELYYSDQIFTIDATAGGDGALYITEIHVEVDDNNVRTFDLILSEKLQARVTGVDAIIARTSNTAGAVGMINVGAAGTGGGGGQSHPQAYLVSSTPAGSLAINSQQGLTFLLTDGDGLAADGTTLDVDLSTNSGLEFSSGELQQGTGGSVTASSSNAVSGATHTHAATTTSDARTDVSTILQGDGDGRIRLDGLRLGNVTTPSDHLVLDTLVDAKGEGYVPAGASAFTAEWKIDTDIGAGYFAYLEADQMHVRLFQADVTMAKANGLVVTDSVAVLAADFTALSVGNPVTISVDDNPALGAARVFASGDTIRMRAFKRAVGLSIFDLWGVVTSYSDNSDGTQDWTFTAGYTGVGGGAAGLVVKAGTPIIGYGVSGQGWWEVDARRDIGPFTRIGTWAGANPWTPANRTINLMTGRLLHLTGTDEYGFYAGKSIDGAHALLTDTTLELQDVSISMREGTADSANIGIYALELNSDVESSIAPNVDVAQDNVTASGTPYWGNIDNDPNSGSMPDADLIHNASGESASISFGMEDISHTLTTLEIVVYATVNSFVDDKCQFMAQMRKADGTTALSDEIRVVSESTTEGVVTVQFTGLVTDASDAEWAAARLYCRWVYFIQGSTEILTINQNEGINILIEDSASHVDGRALTFTDTDDVTVGGIYGRFLDSTGGVYLKLAIGEDGNYDAVAGLGPSALELDAYSVYDENARVQLRAVQKDAATTGTESRAYMQLYSGEGSGAASDISMLADYVHIEEGGLVVGSSSYAPDLGQVILDQGAGDGDIIQLISDVAHGMTDVVPTYVYGGVSKASPTLGGIAVRGFSTTTYANIQYGMAATADTTEATSSRAPFLTASYLKSGTNITGMGADDNIFVAANAGNAQFIVKGDGELFSNFSATVGTFDKYNDMALISTIANVLGGDILKSEWDDFVTYNRSDLARLDIVTETGFVNWHNMTKLFVGAFRQFNDRVSQLEAQLGRR